MDGIALGFKKVAQNPPSNLTVDRCYKRFILNISSLYKEVILNT